MLDLYCERTGPGLWAEPLNAVTNLAFLVAAWAAWRFARQTGTLDSGAWTLIGLTAFIGIGSGLFHMFATSWARVLDEVPILVFQLVFLALYFSNLARMRAPVIAVCLVAYVAAALYCRRFPELLNGSVLYIPALTVLLVLGLYHLRHQPAARAGLLAGAVVLNISIFFRSVDNALCAALPSGTHFFWHLLNALLLYLVMRAYLANRVVPAEGRVRGLRG